MKYIAFVCKKNRARSQMAQACFNHLKRMYFPLCSEYEAISWGTNLVVEGMNQKITLPMGLIGVDMTDGIKYFPKDIHSRAVWGKLDNVVRIYTMGCDVELIDMPEGLNVAADWGLEDPANEEVDVFELRDRILGKTIELIQGLLLEQNKPAWGRDP